MVTVLRDPRMWVAAVLATVIGSIGWTLVLGMMASGLQAPPPPTQAVGADGQPRIELPVIRKDEPPEQPFPAVLLAGGIALLLFGAAGFVSFVVVNRLNADENEPT